MTEPVKETNSPYRLIDRVEDGYRLRRVEFEQFEASIAPEVAQLDRDRLMASTAVSLGRIAEALEIAILTPKKEPHP